MQMAAWSGAVRALALVLLVACPLCMCRYDTSRSSDRSENSDSGSWSSGFLGNRQGWRSNRAHPRPLFWRFATYSPTGISRLEPAPTHVPRSTTTPTTTTSLPTTQRTTTTTTQAPTTTTTATPAPTTTTQAPTTTTTQLPTTTTPISTTTTPPPTPPPPAPACHTCPPPAVAPRRMFRAYMDHDTRVPPMGVLTYGGVEEQQGGGLHPNDGYYRCPDDGTYMFTVGVSKLSDHASEVWLVQAGSVRPLAALPLTEGEVGALWSATALTMCRRGQSVWAEVGGHNNVTFHGTHTYFMGARLN